MSENIYENIYKNSVTENIYENSVTENVSVNENENDIEMIKIQTGINDIELITKIYDECNNNLIETVYKLLDINLSPLKIKELTEFDIMRNILDEKDTIYQQLISQQKNI